VNNQSLWLTGGGVGVGRAGVGAGAGAGTGAAVVAVVVGSSGAPGAMTVRSFSRDMSTQLEKRRRSTSSGAHGPTCPEGHGGGGHGQGGKPAEAAAATRGRRRERGIRERRKGGEGTAT
jgi:hypothetical protein